MSLEATRFTVSRVEGRSNKISSMKFACAARRKSLDLAKHVGSLQTVLRDEPPDDVAQLLVL